MPCCCSKKGKSDAGGPKQNGEYIFTLDEATAPDGVVEQSFKFIEAEGIETGVYRVPGGHGAVLNYFTAINGNPNVNIRGLNLPTAAVASGIKQLFRDKLPPTLPVKDVPEIYRIAKITDKAARFAELKKYLSTVPPTNIEAMKMVFGHLSRVAKFSDVTQMDSSNLARVWCISLFRIEATDISTIDSATTLFQMLIDQYQYFFCGGPMA